MSYNSTPGDSGQMQRDLEERALRISDTWWGYGSSTKATEHKSDGARAQKTKNSTPFVNRFLKILSAY